MTEPVEKSIIVKLTSTAVLSASLAATTLIYFYENYRIPLKVIETTVNFKDISLKNEELVREIDKEKSAQIELQNRLNATKLSIEGLNERILSQKRTINELHQANLFHPNSFYPVGYGTPRIGDDIDLLRKIHKNEKLEWKSEDDSDWKVKVTIDDGYFNTVEYDYDEKTRKITGVVFDTESNDQVLLRLISDIGGSPTQSRRYNVYRWRISKDTNSFLIANHLYMILSGNMEPGLWREPSEP